MKCQYPSNTEQSYEHLSFLTLLVSSIRNPILNSINFIQKQLKILNKLNDFKYYQNSKKCINIFTSALAKVLRRSHKGKF